MLHLSRELNWNWEDFISLAGQDGSLEQKNKPSDLTQVIASRIFQNVQDIVIGEDSLSALLELKRKIDGLEQEPLGLKGKALLLNEVLRALKQKISSTFRHPKELIKDVDDVLKPLLKAKAEEEQAASQKGKEEIGKSSGSLACKTIDQLDQFPTEILLAIFQQLSPENFGSLACVNKQFYEISKIEQACTFAEQVPSYISQSTNSYIQKMTPWKQMQLATHIHNKLLSDQPLPCVFEKQKHPVSFLGLWPFPKTVIQNYFALSTEPGVVQIYDLKTGQKQSFCPNATKQAITACIAIKTPKPLIATFTTFGFKIWDLDQIMQEDEAKNIFEQTGNPDDADNLLALSEIYDSDLNSNYGTVPVITSYKGLLGVGYTNYIKLFDCAQTGFPSLKIEFQNVKQIQLTDEALMLVSKNDLAIWDLKSIKEALANKQSITLQSALRVSPCKQASIKLAKICEDKLVIAYQQIYNQREGEDSGLHAGEVRSWKTNELLRSLILSPKFLKSSIHSDALEQLVINTLIFQKDNLITGSYRTCVWNLKTTDSRQVISNNLYVFNSVHKIYALDSKNILIADSKHLTLVNLGQKNLSSITIRNELISSDPSSHNADKRSLNSLISCQLIDSYLILQTYHRERKKTVVKVYDLSRKSSISNM